MEAVRFISPSLVSGKSFRAFIAAGAVAVGCICPGAWAKEPSLTAIELFDGASGPAYVQLADVLINGKAEMRVCTGAETGSVEKSAYNKFQKTGLGTGGVLERGADGVLRYSQGDGPGTCVVPDNIKFEHNASFTPAAMADSADLRARAVAPGSDGGAVAQSLKKGVKLVFIAAPDVERAEYLLAQRIGNIAGWKNYLGKYPGSPHSEGAKKVLAGMYVDAGTNALGAYQKSSAYADLKTAQEQMGLAHEVLPNSDGEIALGGAIKSSLDSLAAKASSEVDAYKTALKSGTAGFVHLQNAKALVDGISEVDPTFVGAQKARNDVMQAGNAYEAALRAAETAVASKQWDEAVKQVEPYKQFAGEQPRVAKVLDSAYSAYLTQGQQLEDSKDWQNAIASFQSALKVKDTAEAHQDMETAKKELGAVQDQAGANSALEKSKEYELQKDMIQAYEVLTALPQPQRVIVKDEITRLTPDYITAASQRAKEIAGAYQSIHGIGDEKAVENAYAYLQRAYDLSDVDTDKQAFELRLQNLADELSVWFLDRAKHSLQKPLGSGTELGWAYLKEAEAYKAANLEAVRDQMKMADPAHGMHSRLSIRVQFRDQTSQRQSEGFANQMESAIAAGLDTSGMPVRVIRSGETVREGVEPDFLIAGDVLEHHIAYPSSVVSVDSKYIAGVHEVQSDEWNKANRQVDSASEQLHTAQAVLQGAKTKGKKKEIEDAERQVSTAQQNLDSARVTLDSIAKSKTEDIIRPYSYKKTTYDVLNRVVLQFRIDDTFNNQKGEPVQVPKEEKKQFVTLTDVSASDVNGVKAEYSLPDWAEMLNQLDNQAREELTVKVHDKIMELPHKIYDVARQKEQEGYPDDAGEIYMRYLSVAPADQTEERDHAEKFLREQFNFQVFPGSVREPMRRTPPLEQGMAQPAK
jgi:tetratricopeptide (TPR) repeat protein